MNADVPTLLLPIRLSFFIDDAFVINKLYHLVFNE